MGATLSGAATDVTKISRVVLGTVQIGVPYGRARRGPLMHETAAYELLDRAWALGVRDFDTAESYGVSAERLAKWLRARGHLQNARVSTKIVTDSGNVPATRDELSRRVADAIARFRGAKKILLLTHGFTEGESWDIVASAAAVNGATSGQSVYGKAEAEAAIRLDGVERLQLPANIFFSSLPDRATISARRVGIDCRSVFLQGVLLDFRETAERRVPGAGYLAEAIRDCASELECNPAVLLILAVLRRLTSDDRVVIGADNVDELDVLALLDDVSEEDAQRFVECARARVPGPIEPRLLDPRLW